MLKILSGLALAATLLLPTVGFAEDGAMEAPAAEAADAKAPAEAAPAEEAPKPSEVEAILAQMPALYAARDQNNNAKKAIDLLEKAKAEAPQNYEVRWRLAQFHYWIADTSPSKEKMAQEGKLGWDEAEMAKKLNPSGIDGYYWTAACVGAYSTGSGIMNAVKQGLSDVFKDNAEKALSINPNHDKGGPMRALGRYYFKLPWPLSDKTKSRDYLEKAVKVGPTSARNLYYLADLERDEGNTERATELLQQIIALNPAKTDGPDTRFHQKLAREMLAGLK